MEDSIMIRKNKKTERAFKLRTAGIAAITTLFLASHAFAQKKPLKVIILAGQSNMQKPCNWTTLKGLADTPETKPLYDKFVDETGKVRVFPDVREAIVDEKTIDENGNPVPVPNFGSPLPYKFGGLVLPGDKSEGVDPSGGKDGEKKSDPVPGGSYGPELGFGVALHEQWQEPILIIKTAWGGKSLYKDFRPPTGAEWVPPTGHPDHPDSAPKPLPIPADFALPADFKQPEGPTKNMQIFNGIPCGEINGIYPVYVSSGYGERGELRDIPIEKGDLILGVNGAGFPKDPVKRWRDVWFNEAREGDWMMTITRWRAGKIETIPIDTGKAMEGGRAGMAEFVAKEKAAKKKLNEEGGEYYVMMINRIKEVLADPGNYHPAYDPAQGVEMAGFVWFHGYNDYVSSTAYPNGNKPRGYEQYSWLLSHLIRNVRKEVNAPKMPVVIGVFGQGGDSDTAVQIRAAQAAVADYEEFKGNVVAVQTMGFNDLRIPELQGKPQRVMAYDGNDPNHEYAKLQAKVRAYEEQKMAEVSKLPDKARGRATSKIKKEIPNIVRTEEETKYLENNVSNQGFHYYGSPKFFVRAGEAFAKALIGLRE